mgnify:CR=1 FL=1
MIWRRLHSYSTANFRNYSNSWKSKKECQRSDRSLVHEAVTDDEIARIISRWTGIPVTRLTEGERAKLLTLEDQLHKRVVGQDEGVKRVTDAILRSKAGIKDPTKLSVLSCSLVLQV